MSEESAGRLEAIINSIDAHMYELRTFGYDDSTQLLAMAKLDLQTKLHGISDAELQSICDAVKSKTVREGKVIDLLTRKAFEGKIRQRRVLGPENRTRRC